MNNANDDEDFIDRVSDFLERYKKPIGICAAIATLGAFAIVQYHGESGFQKQGIQDISAYENISNANVKENTNLSPIKNNGKVENYFVLATNIDYGNQTEKYYNCLVNKNHVPPENIYFFRNATPWDVMYALNIIWAKSDSDDNLLVYLSAHGNDKGLVFGGHELYYNILESYVQPKLNFSAILIDACYSGVSIPILEHENRIVATQVDSEQIARGNNLGKYFFEAMGCDTKDEYVHYKEPRIEPDKNHDGKVSYDEALYYAKMKISKNPIRLENGTLERHDPQISDPSGIAENRYLI